MREVVIMTAARPPIGKAYRGALNGVLSAPLAAIPSARPSSANIEPSDRAPCNEL